MSTPTLIERTLVIVQARNLETEACSRRTFEVEPLLTGQEQLAEVEQLVAVNHPDARLEAFADGTGTFLDRCHSIQARYVVLSERPDDARARPAIPGQEHLFAA